MEKEEVIFQSHAKVILLGDHSVVYGYPSFAIPLLNTKIIVKISFNRDNIIDTIGFKGDINNLPNSYLGIKYLINEFQKEDRRNIYIKIDSSIPFSKGMGSSAASSLALTRALNEIYQKNYDEDKILELSTNAENLIHGKASGLDLATANSLWPIMFCKGQKEYIESYLDAYLLIGDTGILKNTKKAVSLVREEYDYSDEYKKYIDNLGDITLVGIKAYKDKDIDKLGEAFLNCQRNLKALNVSLDVIDRLVETSVNAGATGAKLSGGGLGGIVIALAKDEITALHIRDSMLKNGAIDVFIEKI